MRIVALVGSLLTAALLIPAAALAQTPTADQYQPIQPSGGGGGSAGFLPFTGLDVAGLVVVAVALVITGFALDRLSHRRPAEGQ
jgi:multisubunit Na+/H+ antiporter MnhB subunit